MQQNVWNKFARSVNSQARLNGSFTSAIAQTIAPTDYRLFGKPKQQLRGNHYASVDDVKRGVQTWIKRKPAPFFERGIGALLQRLVHAVVQGYLPIRQDSFRQDSFRHNT